MRVEHLGDVATGLDAGDMKDLTPAWPHADILALIWQRRVRARDDIAEMFTRRIGVIHKPPAKD